MEDLIAGVGHGSNWIIPIEAVRPKTNGRRWPCCLFLAHIISCIVRAPSRQNGAQEVASTSLHIKLCRQHGHSSFFANQSTMHSRWNSWRQLTLHDCTTTSPLWYFPRQIAQTFCCRCGTFFWSQTGETLVSNERILESLVSRCSLILEAFKQITWFDSISSGSSSSSELDQTCGADWSISKTSNSNEIIVVQRVPSNSNGYEFFSLSHLYFVERWLLLLRLHRRQRTTLSENSFDRNTDTKRLTLSCFVAKCNDETTCNEYHHKEQCSN